MGIDICTWRSTIGLHNSRLTQVLKKVFFSVGLNAFKTVINICSLIYTFIRNSFISVNLFFILHILLLLLISSGDIETNPGPISTTDSISILHCNIRSIRNKLEYIKDLFLESDILCFTETHLDNQVSTDSILIDNKFDSPIRKDRNSHGGGILVYIQKNLVCERLLDLEIFCPESVWIQLKNGKDKILLGVFYSPKTADRDFFHNFNLNIEAAYDISKHIILLGDLNEDLLNPNFHNLQNIMYINSLKNVIEKPTRLNALLDPILVPHVFNYLDADTIDTNSEFTDHKATYITVPFLYNVNPCFERQIWLYDKGNYELLNNKLHTHNWEELINDDVNTACSRFTNTFLTYVKQCIPQKTIFIRPDDKPWFDSNLRKFCRIRDRLKKKAFSSGRENDLKKYKSMRNKVNNMKKNAKENFFNNLEITLCDLQNGDSKGFWKIIRHFVKDQSSSAIPPICSQENGIEKILVTNIDKAEFLNDFFVSISNVNDQHIILPEPEKKTENILGDIIVSENEIQEIILNLKLNKACGHDYITHRMLKATCMTVSKPLSILFNRSIQEGVFPDIWKIANVTPIFKKGDKSDVSNYRPVSLLSCCGKLFERIIFKHLYNFFLDNDLLYKYQSGFLPGHSTTYQLIDIYHHVCQTFDNKQFACMVFCDISKAFDRVWHKGLLYKLECNGISGKNLTWLHSYLKNRSQRVVIQSSESSLLSINAGVPQGSVLGPLLFLIYVNDITEHLLSLTRLYADDSSLFYSASNIRDIEGIINHDLSQISQWAKQWLVNFNPNKTEVLLFSFNETDLLPELLFEGTKLNFVHNHKHLGLTLSDDGKWKSHIDKMLSSASKILGIMRKMKFLIGRKAINQMYISYLRPLLEYASIVWDGCTQQEALSLERIQHEAARIVTGLTRSVSLEKLYNECGWESLSCRRLLQKYVFMYKSKNDMVPSYINDLFPELVNERTGYPLRNETDYTIPLCRTEKMRISCIPSSIEVWNKLNVDIKSSDTLSSFKTSIQNVTCNKADVPIYYSMGKRYPSIIHARLRNNCSNLNCDLFNNFLTHSPYCSCNNTDIEDAEHYLFKCKNYVNQRIQLFNETRKYHPLNINTLLFGNKNLTDVDNTFIFNSVQTFIINTKRFT